MKFWGYGNDFSADRIRSAYYASYDDFSWWNVRGNHKLNVLLTLKSILTHPFSQVSYKVYDYENPYLRAFIRDSEVKKKRYMGNIVTFDNYTEDNQFTIFFIQGNDESYKRLWDMFPTVRLTDDVEAAYKIMEAKYNGTVDTELPRELLLISMMSLKEPTPTLVEELIAVMKERDYCEYAIERMRKELEELKSEDVEDE